MIGRTVSHYEILEAIGEGGMGVVYLARDTALERNVALKFPSRQAFDHREELARFVNEARAAAALDHPNICTIHEIAEHDGQTFIAMGLVEGETIKQKVTEGRLSLDEALDIAIQAAEGLQAANDKGIIHRDIKSANIMVTSKGQVKIMDFGLAMMQGRARITKTSTTVGTTAYMSPEQARGDAVDARSDLFSLGVVFYEMLTGSLPFDGDLDAAVIYSIINMEPEPLTDHGLDLPAGVQLVLDKVLEKDPEDRFQTADELLLALNDLRRRSEPRIPGRRSGARRLVRGIGLALAVASLMVAGYGVINRFVSQDRVDSAATTHRFEPFVVAVAPFWGHTSQGSEDGKVMQALVARRIDDVLGREENVRLLADADLEAPRFHSDARSLGQAMGATIVIWGEVLELRGDVEIQPYVTVIQPVVRIKDRSVDALEIGLEEPEQLSLRKAKADETGDMALLVAGAYYRHRDADQALTFLARIEPPTAESLRQQGNIHYDKGDFPQARQRYEEAIGLSADDPAPYLSLSQCCLALRRFDEAVTAARKAYDLDPTDPVTIRNLGSVHVRVGKYEEAVANFNEALEIDPADAVAHDGLGWTYHRQMMLAEAEAEYKKAIALDPRFANPHNNLGWAYYQQKRFEEALAEYERAIEIDSTLAWPYNNLGWHHLQTGDPARAVSLFEKAILLDPAIVKPRVNLLYANYRLGRTEESLAAARELHAVDSTFVNTYVITAAIHSDRDEHDEAIGAMKRAVALRPESSTIRANLAKTYVAAGRWEEAIASNRKAIELAPDDPERLYDLGITFQRAGEYGNAAQSFGEALDIGDEDPYYHVYYYLNLWRSGNADQARRHIKSVAERFPMGHVITNMIRFYAGEMTEEAVLVAASSEDPAQDRERKCEAYYYLGAAYLIGVDSAGLDQEIAREYFGKCLATEVEPFIEYKLASIEFDKLDR